MEIWSISDRRTLNIICPITLCRRSHCKEIKRFPNNWSNARHLRTWNNKTPIFSFLWAIFVTVNRSASIIKQWTIMVMHNASFKRKKARVRFSRVPPASIVMFFKGFYDTLSPFMLKLLIIWWDSYLTEYHLFQALLMTHLPDTNFECFWWNSDNPEKSFSS